MFGAIWEPGDGTRYSVFLVPERIPQVGIIVGEYGEGPATWQFAERPLPAKRDDHTTLVAMRAIVQCVEGVGDLKGFGEALVVAGEQYRQGMGFRGTTVVRACAEGRQLQRPMTWKIPLGRSPMLVVGAHRRVLVIPFVSYHPSPQQVEGVVWYMIGKAGVDTPWLREICREAIG